MLKYECPNCGVIGSDDVVEERCVDLEPYGDRRVERVTTYISCSFCGTEDLEVYDHNRCLTCE